MFGTKLDGTRGNTVRHNPDRVVMYYVDVPNDFLRIQKFITLVFNTMFVKVEIFLITMSCGIKFVNIKHITTRIDNQMSNIKNEL